MMAVYEYSPWSQFVIKSMKGTFSSAISMSLVAPSFGAVKNVTIEPAPPEGHRAVVLVNGKRNQEFYDVGDEICVRVEETGYSDERFMKDIESLMHADRVKRDRKLARKRRRKRRGW